MRGSGKSTLCKKIQNFYPNVFIFDTLNEYENFNNTFYNYKEFSDYVIRTKDVKGLRAVIRFPIEESQDHDYFDEFIKILYHRGNCTIVIEEIQNFASVYKIAPFLKQSSLTGRHKNINFITTTQRIAEIHKSLISQAHHIFTGYTDSPNDKKTLREYGFDLNQVEKLDKYQFLWKNQRNMCLINNNIEFLENHADNMVNDQNNININEGDLENEVSTIDGTTD